jgi:hypothetical protein
VKTMILKIRFFVFIDEPLLGKFVLCEKGCLKGCCRFPLVVMCYTLFAPFTPFETGFELKVENQLIKQ